MFAIKTEGKLKRIPLRNKSKIFAQMKRSKMHLGICINLSVVLAVCRKVLIFVDICYAFMFVLIFVLVDCC